MNMITRRKALTASTALAAGAALASCSTTGGVDMEAIATAINRVQTAVAQACTAVGEFVPTADTVWKLLSSIMGVPATNPVMVTVASVEEAIKLITQTACPAPAAGGPPRAGVPASTVKVKDVDVHFIPLRK